MPTPTNQLPEEDNKRKQLLIPKESTPGVKSGVDSFM